MNAIIAGSIVVVVVVATAAAAITVVAVAAIIIVVAVVVVVVVVEGGGRFSGRAGRGRGRCNWRRWLVEIWGCYRGRYARVHFRNHDVGKVQRMNGGYSGAVL